MYSLKSLTPLLLLLVTGVKRSDAEGFQQNPVWQNGSSGFVSWRAGCDYPNFGTTNNDISNEKSPKEDCGQRCLQGDACTHFSWTPFQGGTCWLKGGEGPWELGGVFNKDAVCGFVKPGMGNPGVMFNSFD